MLAMAKKNRLETIRGITEYRSFDNSDAVLAVDDDEITAKYEVPAPWRAPETTLVSLEDLEAADLEEYESDRAKTEKIESDKAFDEELRRHGGLGVFEAFEAFWPDHAFHDMLVQGDEVDNVTLQCVQCDLKLSIPVRRFSKWLLGRR